MPIDNLSGEHTIAETTRDQLADSNAEKGDAFEQRYCQAIQAGAGKIAAVHMAQTAIVIEELRNEAPEEAASIIDDYEHELSMWWRGEGLQENPYDDLE